MPCYDWLYSVPPPISVSTDFVSAIQPATSQGYLYWKEVPNAVYKVNLYKKMGSNFIFTTALNSNKNYLKLSSDVLAGKNMYYELIALNHLNGNTLLTGEKTPIENKYKSGSIGSGDDGGANGNDTDNKCTAVCNGPDYAYQLDIWEYPNHELPGYMDLSETYFSMSTIAGIQVVTPFYEAISILNWNQLPNSHPYKTSSYQKVQIIPNGSGIPLFFDKMNQPVFSGWNVQKKTNKFSHMTTAETSATPDPNVYCPATTSNLWISFFNNYTTSADFSDDEWMGYNKLNTTNLVCESGWQNDGHPGGVLSDEEIINDFGTFIDCIYGLEWGSEAWLHCFEVYGFSPNVTPEKPDKPAVDFDRPLTDKPIATKPRIAGIDVSPINSLDEDAANFQLVIDEKGANYHYRTQGLKNGLYYVAYIFSDGTIIPIVTELNFPDKIVSTKEKVEVKISPNKIENNLINLDLKAFDNVRFKLEIKDLAGALIYSEQIDMKKAEQLNKKIAVSSANVAYNQLRLNLLFEDGSSIQQTILK
jgi:hypothetical protein